MRAPIQHTYIQSCSYNIIILSFAHHTTTTTTTAITITTSLGTDERTTTTGIIEEDGHTELLCRSDEMKVGVAVDVDVGVV